MMEMSLGNDIDLKLGQGPTYAAGGPAGGAGEPFYLAGKPACKAGGPEILTFRYPTDSKQVSIGIVWYRWGAVGIDLPGVRESTYWICGLVRMLRFWFFEKA